MSATVESSEIRALVRLTWEVVNSPTDDDKFEKWRAAVRGAHTETLVDWTARLSSKPGESIRDLKALREAIISEIERKNAHDVIRTMEKLDAAASRLTWVSLAVAIIGVVLTIVQFIHLPVK